jgi:hypothetical protein
MTKKHIFSPIFVAHNERQVEGGKDEAPWIFSKDGFEATTGWELKMEGGDCRSRDAPFKIMSMEE